MDNYKKLQCLAASIIQEKDLSAWEPFIDLLIEMGYSSLALGHYNRCGTKANDIIQCDLIVWTGCSEREYMESLYIWNSKLPPSNE